ncbi:hypothetical protein AAFF_G00145790 [Aldrovandia affinis]|uniref:Syntaphilin n=1 Tax=Aldrovandia affinis TaxID=143900 RepID=A0AAD7T1Z3_9TELE|nr:hypothetical protein AAFF_G00145790 [Aldrovandia affinis]
MRCACCGIDIRDLMWIKDRNAIAPVPGVRAFGDLAPRNGRLLNHGTVGDDGWPLLNSSVWREKKRERLPALMSAPVSQTPSAGSHSFDYCRFIELDCIPMETGYMVSMHPSHGPMPHQTPERHRHRTAPPGSTRDPYGNASLCSSTSSSCRGNDSSPTVRPHPVTPRRSYLTPLQQKEVCIRHLRARLRENLEYLQDRDSEIEELRTQLSRMQEDWIEEECHRVEAQLALNDARREIRQLKQVVDVVRTNLGGRDVGPTQQHLQDLSAQNRKLDSLLQGLEDQEPGAGLVRPGLSRSCGGSPARSLTRSSTYTKLSHEVLLDPCGCGPEPGLSGEETQDSGFACGDSRADLLLETLLCEGPPSPSPSSLGLYAPLPRSFTYEKLCTCDAPPLQAGQVSSSSQPCLSYHHLYLHHLRERAIQTDHALPCHAHPKSQSCSPSSTWISEEGEDLDTVTMATAATHNDDPVWSPPPSPQVSCAVELHSVGGTAEPPPQTCQPKGGVTVLEVDEEEAEEEGEGAESEGEALPSSSPPQKSYWSRHFLMDLLAVAAPVVPAVAWLCHGPWRQGQPVYNIGSLLRGCCAVALHSLRRAGGPGRGPVSGRGGTDI